MSTLRLIGACAAATALALQGCGGDGATPGAGDPAAAGGATGASGASGNGISAGASGKGLSAGASGKGASGAGTSGTSGVGVGGSPSGGPGGPGGPGGGPGGSAGGSGAAGAGGSSPTWLDCQDGEQAWVRKAITAVMGRRALGQAEVAVYVDLIAGVDALDGVSPSGPKPAPAVPLKHSRRVALEAMRKHFDAQGRSEYVAHYLDVYRDALRVQRLSGYMYGGQANAACFDGSKRPADPSVAVLVRDASPSSAGDGNGPFTMRDVIVGSLLLDDVSPIYVGNVIAMLQYSYDGANAEPLKLELARRSDFGAWFDGVYLHRDGVCLKCHNSESSVTFDPDPTKNRFFPLPAHLDAAMFDTAFGNDPKTLAGASTEYDGISREHAVLRFDGFSTAMNATQAPWGWDKPCATVVPRAQIAPDPAQVDAKLGGLTGNKVTGWDVTDSLQRGFAKLRAHGLTKAADGTVSDADEAFAYMVSSNVVERIWREVVGTPLTIANYFPRNAAARDQLALLVDGFVSHGFSQAMLLELVTASPAFNVLAPDAGCGGVPYAMPAIYDPWVLAEDDPARRGNSLGDGVFALSTRTLVRTTYGALAWPDEPASFFESATQDSDFEGEIGLFLKNSEPGFRGFDFQARLSWEDRFATCQKPLALAKPDFVADLLAVAGTVPGATVRDVLAALKDRLVGDARVDEKLERPALEALLSASLDDPASKLTDPSLRRVCGVVLSSPQFLLGGVVPKDAATIPKLLPPAFGYTPTCKAIADAGLDGLTVSCAGAKLSVSK